MDGYVDPGAHGVTELRVHGVSGTSPQDMLENPHVHRVAGDEAAGFFRRVWLERRPEGAGGEAELSGRRREAYSWGGLTSGSSWQALWLLLLPFTLTNVAFWMWPAASGTDSRALRNSATALQRLFALSLTAMIVLTAVMVVHDLLAWQCAGPRLAEDCIGPHGYLRFLTYDLLAAPGRRLALMTLVPVGLVALLWALARATWNDHERLLPPARQVRASEPALAQPRMWNGAESVRRLRAVHVAVALALPGVFLVAPLWASTPSPAWHQDAALLLLVLYVVGCTAALLAPDPWRRRDPVAGDGTAGRTDDVRDRWQALPLVGLVLLLASVGSAISTTVPEDELAPALPFLADTLVALYFGQAGLLVALLALTAMSSRASRGQDGGAGLPGRALWGLGLPVVLLVAWVTAGGLSAGVVIRTADVLGTPVPLGAGSGAAIPMWLSPGYAWAAAATVCLVVALSLAGGLVAGWSWWQADAVEGAKVEQAYKAALDSARSGSEPALSAEGERRKKAIQRTWVVARLTERVPLLVGVLAWVLALAVVGGSLAYWYADRWVLGQPTHGLALPERLPWLVTAGSWMIGLLALAVLALTRSAYRSPGLRRVVGIVWDLATFWPRATHPLAPPCYMERALPDLRERIRWLTAEEGDLVVLSTHSQGTVMAAAVVLQSDLEQRTRLSLLTYGSPLQRLYQRFFPAYFNEAALREVRTTLSPQPAAPDPCRSRWRNLYRYSDPIGGPVLHSGELCADWYGADLTPDQRKQQVLAAGIDLHLLDPVFPRPPGDPAYPSALCHSDYFRDPYFEAAVQAVIELAQPTSGTTTPSGG